MPFTEAAQFEFVGNHQRANCQNYRKARKSFLISAIEPTDFHG